MGAADGPAVVAADGAVRKVELAHENDCKYVQARGGAVNAALYNVALINLINIYYENQAAITFQVVYEHFY